MIVMVTYNIAGERKTLGYSTKYMPPIGAYLTSTPGVIDDDTEKTWLRVDRIVIDIHNGAASCLCSVAAAEVVAEIKLALGEG